MSKSALQYKAVLLFIFIFENSIIMKPASFPKSEWERVEESNLGHTKDEWGKPEDTPKICIMEVYDLKWNIDKKKDESN